MEEAKKREHTKALKKAEQLCKEFGFTPGMLQGVLAQRSQSISKNSKAFIG